MNGRSPAPVAQFVLAPRSVRSGGFGGLADATIGIVPSRGRWEIGWRRSADGRPVPKLAATAEGEQDVTQIIVDSLLRSSQISLLAIGLTLVYSLLRFPNFAHVEFAAVGAFVAFLLSATVGLPLVVAVALALLVAGTLGWLLDRAVFARLRGGTPILMMIASFGLGIALREGVRAIWGSSPRFYEVGLQAPLRFLGATITPVQIWVIATAAASVVAFYVLLNFTRLGTAMRATADNPRLAEASGIYSERVIGTVWFLGSAFAALGGVLIGLDTQLHPQMGFAIIIPVFAAAILGGIGNPYGAVAGALVLGFAENVGLAIDWAPLLGIFGYGGDAAYIPTGFRQAIPFALLIVVLLLRPQGIFGNR